MREAFEESQSDTLVPHTPAGALSKSPLCTTCTRRARPEPPIKLPVFPDVLEWHQDNSRFVNLVLKTVAGTITTKQPPGAKRAMGLDDIKCTDEKPLPPTFGLHHVHLLPEYRMLKPTSKNSEHESLFDEIASSFASHGLEVQENCEHGVPSIVFLCPELYNRPELIIALENLLNACQYQPPVKKEKLDAQFGNKVFTDLFKKKEAPSRIWASGLKWKVVGPVKPSIGIELVNENLSATLRNKVEFTKKVWASFGIKELYMDHFVKSGDNYYRPAAVGKAPPKPKRAEGNALQLSRDLAIASGNATVDGAKGVASVTAGVANIAANTAVGAGSLAVGAAADAVLDASTAAAVKRLFPLEHAPGGGLLFLPFYSTTSSMRWYEKRAPRMLKAIAWFNALDFEPWPTTPELQDVAAVLIAEKMAKLDHEAEEAKKLSEELLAKGTNKRRVHYSPLKKQSPAVQNPSIVRTPSFATKMAYSPRSEMTADVTADIEASMSIQPTEYTTKRAPKSSPRLEGPGRDSRISRGRSQPSLEADVAGASGVGTGEFSC